MYVRSIRAGALQGAVRERWERETAMYDRNGTGIRDAVQPSPTLKDTASHVGSYPCWPTRTRHARIRSWVED
eukprot:3555829-Pleurochrysis_carterae.AAC.1